MTRLLLAGRPTALQASRLGAGCDMPARWQRLERRDAVARGPLECRGQRRMQIMACAASERLHLDPSFKWYAEIGTSAVWWMAQDRRARGSTV